MKNKYLPYLLIIALWFLFSMPFLIFGKAAFPSSYQVNNFPPWSTYSELGGPVKNNAQPDIITQIYPWRHFAIEEMKQGRLPLWNPYSFAGNPHLANYQSAVLFPLNILFFSPLSFIYVWSLIVVLQPLFAGIFTYLLARKFGISSLSSLVSAFSFMFCGFLVTWMGYATLGYAIVPLPLAFLAIESYKKGKEIIWGTVLSSTIMFSFLSGHFQTSIYFFMATAGFCLFKNLTVRKKESLGIWYFVLIGMLLAMPQVLPSIELYLHSVRSDLFQKMEAIPWSYLPTLLAPDYYGNPVTRNDWFGHYAEWNGYTGTVGLILAVLAVFVARSRKSIFFIILGLISLLLAFNTPLLSLLVWLKVPVLSTSAASRIIVLFSFSVAMLAGFGLDKLIKGEIKKKTFLIFATGIGVIILFITIIPFLSFFPSDKSTIAKKNIILPILTIGIFLIGWGYLIISKKKVVKLILIVIILSLSAFEMYRFSSKWQSFDEKEKVFIENPTTEYYSKYDLPDRFFGDFTAENSVYYRLPVLGGYDPLYIGRYGEFIRFIYSGQMGSGERSVVNVPKRGIASQKALDFLGVKYIAHKVSDGNLPWAFPFSDYPVDQFEKIHDDSHYQIFLNKKSYPRAFIVNKVVSGTDKRKILDGMYDSDLSEVGFIEKTITLDQASGSASIDLYDPGHIKVTTKTTGRSLLLLTDNFYPGWNVKVNGSNQELLRTDYTFMGVVVPSGTSTVEFLYRPQSFFVGVYMFLIGVLAIITVIVVKRLRMVK